MCPSWNMESEREDEGNVERIAKKGRVGESFCDINNTKSHRMTRRSMVY